MSSHTQLTGSPAELAYFQAPAFEDIDQRCEQTAAVVALLQQAPLEVCCSALSAVQCFAGVLQLTACLSPGTGLLAGQRNALRQLPGSSADERCASRLST